MMRRPPRSTLFPSRRSSDLVRLVPDDPDEQRKLALRMGFPPSEAGRFIDRKSTRLNSSHLGISYAVFCLKKKTAITTTFAFANKTRLPSWSSFLFGCASLRH